MKIAEKQIVIGVDIGGTKIMAGAVADGGRTLGEPVTVATGGNDDGEKIIGRITGSIRSAIGNSGLSLKDIKGIGLGVTGPVDSKTGRILECPQLPTLHDYPLRDTIHNEFGLPVYMDNDANALVLGESLWGAGKGCRVVLGYTLGTGLGCALVIDRKLFMGAHGMAGEIWPSPWEEGTIEDVVSGSGTSAIYRRLSNQSRSAKEIAKLADEGDVHAVETWKIFGNTLAKAIAWGINMFDPNIVVLGGSMVNSMHLFSIAMEETLRRHICPVPAKKTRVVNAAFDDEAGFIGAAALAIRESLSKPGK